MTFWDFCRRIYACGIIAGFCCFTLWSAAEALFGKLEMLVLLKKNTIATGCAFAAGYFGCYAPSSRKAEGLCLLILAGCTFVGLFASLLAISILAFMGWQGAEPPITFGSATYLNYGGGDFVAHGSSALWQLLFGTAFLVVGGLWSRDREA